ncbi:hypothetical protein [Variovorax sp. YR216]|uniref:hypothetical protein n=1 Tax=Variovorax sp. YR216 TaxID=1882828 RepID=UPI00089CA588|nr:hypothetical protein [Variovorax sp. YR216]SEB17476.1 hypothetical protein SAMN05444680_111105 [Variovorax sp. YR216]
MAQLWPWLVVAGSGALHGLNPTTGWMFAAVWGLRSGDRSQVLRALTPIAGGHAASIALVAAAVALGVSMDRAVLQATAAGLLVIALLVHLSGRKSRHPDPQLHGHGHGPVGHAGLALWSFMMSTAHGAGLMLVPALVPLCMGSAPGQATTASGALALALTVVGIHTTAMLAVTALIATGVCHGFDSGRRLVGRLTRAGASASPRLPCRPRIRP